MIWTSIISYFIFKKFRKKSSSSCWKQEQYRIHIRYQPKPFFNFKNHQNYNQQMVGSVMWTRTKCSFFLFASILDFLFIFHFEYLLNNWFKISICFIITFKFNFQTSNFNFFSNFYQRQNQLPICLDDHSFIRQIIINLLIEVIQTKRQTKKERKENKITNLRKNQILSTINTK